MGDIKFSCPSCHQHITCDELWGGHELACPSCQTPLVVPAPAPQSAAAAHAGGNPLVPKPPQSAAARLSRPQEPAAAQPRGIPIRNLAPPPSKKKNPALMVLKIVAIIAVVAAGSYFALVLVRNMQAKANAKRQAEEGRNSGESQVGHIAELNAVMDATEPGGAGSSRGPRSASRRQRPPGMGPPVPVAADGSAGGASPDSTASLNPPVWTLDVIASKIPEGPVNGTLSGTNFVPEATRIEPVSGTQILHFLQGQPPVPDREIFIYLHLKPGEKLGGQTLTISSDMKGSGVPQVTKRWRADPRYAPQVKSFLTGYAMKLELGPLADFAVPGKIFLALPDTEQSVVGGAFKATLPGAEPVAAVPMAVPGMNPDIRRRYVRP